MSKDSTKLWQGRFSSAAHTLLENFNNSLTFDWRLWQVDILGSLVHAEMLCKQGIITREDYNQIKSGLEVIALEISPDPQAWFWAHSEYEDIHSALEGVLTERIGEAGRRLHTARSRNDQVATDLKLWLRSVNYDLSELLLGLLEVMIGLAKRDYALILPGYTHLQTAQYISLGHHWLAHFERFSRDLIRLRQCRHNLKESCPLGSGALAGTTFPIDRHFSATELGFSAPSNNSLDSVSDRDFVAEHHFVSALIGVHISQLAEELILWVSEEFGFFELDEGFSTGSSMMPQKKNPDIPELLRGKSARLIGHLQSVLTLLKGLPLAYNKDLQEDKELLFDSCETLTLSLQILAPFLGSLKVRAERLSQLTAKSFMNATDAADYLAKKGVPFREAYAAVGQAVRYCLAQNLYLVDLTLTQWQSFHPEYASDISEVLSPENCLSDRRSYGGTSPEQVKLQIDLQTEKLNHHQESLKIERESDAALRRLRDLSPGNY
ncbi:MAG: argininosuccinate lyase [Candidatus Caenarcaniphilales bacterium]|nr:argininosuccinate lyase [Candidatus Caenarcaniphilales bacterium]